MAGTQKKPDGTTTGGETKVEEIKPLGGGDVSETDNSGQDGAGGAGDGSQAGAAGSKKGKAPESADELALGGKNDQVDLDSLDLEGVLKHVGYDSPTKQEALATKFAKDGKLDDADYAAFKKAGVPKAVVNRMMELEMTAAAAVHKTIATYARDAEAEAGGADELASLRRWAVENLPKERIERFNKIIKADPSSYPAVVRVMNEEFKKSNAGTSNKAGQRPQNAGSGKPKTRAEWNAVVAKANRGDAAATAIIDTMSMDEIGKLK